MNDPDYRIKPKVTAKERELLEHATGWRAREPLYRNYFAANPDSEDFRAWEALAARELATCRPSSEGSPILPLVYFHVTPLGISALDECRKGKRGRGS